MMQRPGEATCLVIRKAPSGRAAFTLRTTTTAGTHEPEQEPEQEPAPAPPCPPRPVPDPARVLGIAAWRERYGYFVSCMMAMMASRLEGAPLVVDWEGVRARLERFVYVAASSRFRAFRAFK